VFRDTATPDQEQFLMATQNLQVTCVTKRDRQSAHERIQGIGGGATILGRWWHAEDDAIKNIENGLVGYYVSVGEKSVWVVVATHSGRKYLKTEPDGYSPDNLLSLAECSRRDE
jgi:hypothetical protein